MVSYRDEYRGVCIDKRILTQYFVSLQTFSRESVLKSFLHPS